MVGQCASSGRPTRVNLACCLAILFALLWLPAASAAAQEWPLTRAEWSEYDETSRYDDVVDFLRGLEGMHPKL